MNRHTLQVTQREAIFIRNLLFDYWQHAEEKADKTAIRNKERRVDIGADGFVEAAMLSARICGGLISRLTGLLNTIEEFGPEVGSDPDA